MRTYLIALAALLGMMNAEVININANGDPSAAANAIKVKLGSSFPLPL